MPREEEPVENVLGNNTTTHNEDSLVSEDNNNNIGASNTGEKRNDQAAVLKEISRLDS